MGNKPVKNYDSFGLTDKNVKKSIYIMGGPDKDKSHPALPATESIFYNLNHEMFNGDSPKGYKYHRISNHDAPGQKPPKGGGDEKLHKLTEEMLKFKKDWEAKNSKYKCCVDYSGTYFTGKPGAPLTPTLISSILTNPKIKEYDRVMLAAHIDWMPDNSTGLFLGAGRARAGSSGVELVDWGGVVPWNKLFQGVPEMNIEIYTCLNHNVPETSGNVTLIAKGLRDGLSRWDEILPKHIKPWVESECESNKKPK